VVGKALIKIAERLAAAAVVFLAVSPRSRLSCGALPQPLKHWRASLMVVWL
jgi:hypothetical protein